MTYYVLRIMWDVAPGSSSHTFETVIVHASTLDEAELIAKKTCKKIVSGTLVKICQIDRLADSETLID